MVWVGPPYLPSTARPNPVRLVKTMLPFCPLVSPPEPPVPIRLWLPVTVRLPMMSLAADEGPVLPATIVSVSVAVIWLSTPPPLLFPLMVQLVSVAVP